MVNWIKYRSTLVALIVMLSSVIIFTKCMNGGKDKAGTDSGLDFSAYAGSASCATCHKQIFESHIHTAHFKTSAIAGDNTVSGSFDTAKNVFNFSAGASIRMEKHPDGLYQVAYINGVEKKRQRFDLVIGSGTKGQSFAAWMNDNLVQLAVTYFAAAHQWSNSPGYPDRMAFNRPITSRCLECHATFAQVIPRPEKGNEAFDHKKMILGVDCEKCHGPAARHVTYQQQNPNEKKGQYIINPSSFTRRQSLDLCTLCHGGRLQKIKPSFSFMAGDSLSGFFNLDNAPKNADNIDVHGNQFGLLAASKCFVRSETMTCLTCHDPHKNEKGEVALFSQRCMGCHNEKIAGAHICKMTSGIGSQISGDCISCHMPEQPSMAIAVMLQGGQTPTPALMHTHLIKPYPEEARKWKIKSKL